MKFHIPNTTKRPSKLRKCHRQNRHFGNQAKLSQGKFQEKRFFSFFHLLEID